MSSGALPKGNPPAAEPTTPPEPVLVPELPKKAESKILEPKYDKVQICAYDKCPITKKRILFGMHCVFYENKTYHALCGGQVGLNFKMQQPARRPTEAKG